MSHMFCSLSFLMYFLQGFPGHAGLRGFKGDRVSGADILEWLEVASIYDNGLWVSLLDLTFECPLTLSL